MDSRTTKHAIVLALTVGFVLSSAGCATAAPKYVSPAVASSTNRTTLVDVASLEDLVARVALYPDELLAIVLPASTFPLQIVQAARYLEAHNNDPALEPNAQWDESIIALLNYPEVITLLNSDLDWTWQLGEAVINQQADVIVAVERFRERAYAVGNLESDEHKIVNRDDGAIKIASADSDAVYVPYYEPAEVVYQQTVTPYYYYPTRYPLYYYPYSAGHSFYSGAFWGVTTAFTIGWFTNRLHYLPYGYRSHPYYGHHYNRSHFRRHGLHAGRRHLNSANRHQRGYHGDYWNASNRFGHRPRHLAHSGSRSNAVRGRQHGTSNAPLRASNGLLGNGTRNRGSLANRGNTVRNGQRGISNAPIRASNGLIGNGVLNRRSLANRGNAVRGGRQGNASTSSIPRAANGLNGNGGRRGNLAAANIGTSSPTIASGAARAPATGPRQSPARARSRNAAPTGNARGRFSNNTFAARGPGSAATTGNASQRPATVRSQRNRAAPAQRSNVMRNTGRRTNAALSSNRGRSNRSFGRSNRGAGNRSGRGGGAASGFSSFARGGRGR